MIEWLQSKGKPFVIVATKADKLSGNQLRAKISRESAVQDNKLIVYSAVTRIGADRIWKEITTRISDHQPRNPD
jgi:GTP-binding protein